MKVKSIIFAPIPDEEGFQLMNCYHCNEYFLINPNDLDGKQLFCCPYCSLIGGMMSFTTTLRNRYTQDTPLYTPIENFTIDDNSFVSEKWIKEQLEGQTDDGVDDLEEELENLGLEIDEEEEPKVISYEIEEVYQNPMFSVFEFICCEKTIKIPFENVDLIHQCPFCFGEIIR